MATIFVIGLKSIDFSLMFCIRKHSCKKTLKISNGFQEISGIRNFINSSPKAFLETL